MDPTEELRARQTEMLLDAVQELSYARDLDGIVGVVKNAARRLARADGVTFVLRDDDRCWYVDENAIGPLWKGRRFPINMCLSGWAMLHREPLVIEDIYEDARVPQDLYRPTFVRSLVLVPIRRDDPVGAIGAYWAKPHLPSSRELGLLSALAASTATAITNANLYRQLEEALVLREEFIEVAAHELRTPLTPLKMQLHRLGRTLDGPTPSEVHPPLREQLADIDRSVARIERLVETMLDQTSLWTDRLALDRREVDLADVARAAVARVPERLRAAITVDAPCPTTVLADTARLEQAVAQLLDNAVKFGAGKPVRVRISADDGHARLSVSDAGPGIDEATRARLFQRFERGVSVRNFGGFGLGLWIAQQIVDAHGGRIAIESEPGTGAVVTISVPRA